jgi:hypothetical protein
MDEVIASVARSGCGLSREPDHCVGIDGRECDPAAVQKSPGSLHALEGWQGLVKVRCRCHEVADAHQSHRSSHQDIGDILGVGEPETKVDSTRV